MYDSSIEPWSYWLTGKQGMAPQPCFDPLTFAIEEAHLRGMELHAWVNPYRAQRAIKGVTGHYAVDSSHVTVRRPEWILTFEEAGIRILDPGLPDVRDYIASVIMDIVRRYDVDGIPWPTVSESILRLDDHRNTYE